LPVFTLGSVTSPVIGLGVMVRRRWKEPIPSAVHTQDPNTKVSQRLKVTVGLMKIEAIEFATRSSASSLPGVPAVGVLDRQPTKGSTQGR
jgi:hypothetical protein